MFPTVAKAPSRTSEPPIPNRERPAEPQPFQATKEQLLDFYKQMLLIRRFEEKAGQLYGLGLIGGFCHLYIGQEAVAVGLQSALDGDKDTFWSAPAGSRHATLEVDFGHPVSFDRTLSMEWLDDGQHVRKYAIEVFDGKGWRPVAGAEAIGHMKIDVFPKVTAQRVRLNILSSVGDASIREFQVFNAAALPSR